MPSDLSFLSTISAYLLQAMKTEAAKQDMKNPFL
jgi:hypothetical protein